MSEHVRVTLDNIPLKSQFDGYCSKYQELQNEIDLVDQELSEWEEQHKELQRTGTSEEILKHHDVQNEIMKRRDNKNMYLNVYASMLADFSIENKELILAALELVDKKRDLPIRANRPRRGR